MKKLNDENMATSVAIFETNPDQLRRIAERLEQQARDYAQTGQEIIYPPADGIVFLFKPDKVGVINN